MGKICKYICVYCVGGGGKLFLGEITLIFLLFSRNAFKCSSGSFVANILYHFFLKDSFVCIFSQVVNKK